MEDFRKKCGEMADICFRGELTVPKALLWLGGWICFLSGVIYGLRLAPVTHGITIGCYNGNGSSASVENGNQKSGKDKEDEKK